MLFRSKARWNKKHNKNKELDNDANALRTQSEGNATHNTEHITQDTIHKKKATFVATPEGVSDSVWQDFKSLRKAKKAPITQRAIDAIALEAKEVGWSLEKALVECVVRGWQSFKADWIKPKVVDIAKQTVPSRQGRDPVLLKIEEESKQAVPPSLEVLERMAKIRKGVA